MKRENKGIKSQDVLVLSKLISNKDKVVKQMDLARDLNLSQAEIANSLERLKKASLIDESKKKVNKLTAIEFYKYVLKFLFPIEYDGPGRGVAAGPSADFVKEEVLNDELGHVWLDGKGETRGMLVRPIYPTVVESVKSDSVLYKLMCLVDILRGLGGKRHKIFAETELSKIILGK